MCVRMYDAIDAPWRRWGGRDNEQHESARGEAILHVQRGATSPYIYNRCQAGGEDGESP